MSGPQLEDGFTQVAHEILDAICQFNFNGAQFRIIIKIWRLTYGYKRKDHDFAIPYLQKRTRLSESTVKRELSALIKAKVLLVTKEATKTTARRLAFNKHYEQWYIPKGGDSVSKQLELFNEDEGSDMNPPSSDDEVLDMNPHEVLDMNPHSNDFPYFEVSDLTPIEIKRSLNILFKENVTMDLFEYFYSIYPRRISKSAAKKAWDKLAKIKPFDPITIICNTYNFSKTCKLLETEPKFIPHPSTYLNQKRFEDYADVDPEGLAAEKLSKLDSNLDFLKDQIGGGQDGPGSSSSSLSEGIGSLPEQGT